MKKVSISHFVFSIFCLVLSLALFSCTGTGLGEEVDLEAPVLTVKSLESGGTTLTEFAGGVYCKKQITFSGTATDNNRVERVIAQVKWANDENADYVTYSTAQFSDPNWSCTINFEKEGACYVKLAAQDDAKNVSPKSTKVITLFVDDTAPVASAWYIDREVDGIQYNLRALDTLKAVNLDLAENKDAAQNVGFTICANANDTMGIKAISIQIRDETGKKICDIPKIDDVSLYAPKFKVTHDILVNGIDGAGGDASLAHGKHYLQVWYDSEDVITIPSSNVSNDVAVELGWFLWWPESDLPRVTNSEIKDSATDSDGIETGTLNVHVKDSLSLSLFDDDELKQAYFALFTDAEWENYANSFSWSAIESNPKVLKTHIEKADGEENLDEAQANRYKEFTANGERETVISLKTVKDPQRMHLVAIGWDINIADETLPIKPLVKRYITVNVTDESTPILIISSPKNNSIPTVASTSTETSAPVTVSGLTLSAAECQYLEFVWVPDSVANKRAAAESWLKTIEGTTAHDAVVSGTTKDGMKIWKAPLTSSGSQDGFIKSTFSFDFNLLTDFGNDKALDKYFLAKLTRKDGNYIYQDYKLAAYNQPGR